MIDVARIDKTNDIQLEDLLTVEGIETACQISSKKRLMEKITALLMQGRPHLDRKTVLHTLIERERLGSTGIGHGVALPHGRINGLDDVIGAVAVLDQPLEYDSPDKQPIKLAFGLLVPAQANCTSFQATPASASASFAAITPMSMADLPSWRPKGCRPMPMIAMSTPMDAAPL